MNKVLAMAALGLVSNGAVMTPVSAQSNTVSACAKDNSVRIVAAQETCKNNETRVSWNVSGPQGPAGPAGPAGPQGAMGPQGFPGLTGATGAMGATGASGAVGPAGAIGPPGPSGAVGATGPQGPIGLTGPAGAQGPVGPQGSPGPAGPSGSSGPAGNNGTNGAQGPQGVPGPAGPAGPAASNCPVGTGYVDNGDGTVCDKSTGLIWEKKTSGTGGVHDVTNTYAWSGASYGTTNGRDGTLFTVFLAKLNSEGTINYSSICFANKCDWRIPTVIELKSIFFLSPARPTPASIRFLAKRG